MKSLQLENVLKSLDRQKRDMSPEEYLALLRALFFEIIKRAGQVGSDED